MTKSIKEALATEYWGDLTIHEISDVLGVTEAWLYHNMRELKKEGIVVEYKRTQTRRKDNASC